ncbi:hypothetical protein ACOSP7_026446 [Xanthoceras sorbifolium]
MLQHVCRPRLSDKTPLLYSQNSLYRGGSCLIEWADTGPILTHLAPLTPFYCFLCNAILFYSVMSSTTITSVKCTPSSKGSLGKAIKQLMKSFLQPSSCLLSALFSHA